MLRIFVLIILITSGLAHAHQVTKVYRADIRYPDEVFKNGFRSWGTNINYMSHILGISGSLGARNSAFIPTTSSQDVAEGFARERARILDRTYYVYDIRATDNFYPALDSVYHIYDSHHERVSEDVRMTVAREHEYSAYQHISPQQIRSATSFTHVNGRWVQSVIVNPGYVENNSRSHDGPYIGHNTAPSNHTARLLVGPSQIGASFMPPEDAAHSRSALSCAVCLQKFLF